MTVPIAYGIDFGTSNSQISVAYPDRSVVLMDERSDSLDFPSLIFLHRNRNRAAGRSAVEQYLVAGSNTTGCGQCDLVRWTKNHKMYTDCNQFRNGGRCNDARLLSGIKSDLSDRHFDRTHSWGIDFAPSDLVAIVLSALKRIADTATGHKVDRVVLGHPVAFVGAEGPRARDLQDLAEERLRSAASDAGFKHIALFAEPSAALEHEVLEHGAICAVDFGGGTFDVAVIEMPRRPGEVTGMAGTSIGGQDFDALIFREFIAPVLGINDSRLIKRLETLSTAWHLLNNDQRGRQLLAGNSVMEEIIFGGFTYDFYRAIENAKIELSTEAESTISFVRGRSVDFGATICRDQFEELIKPDLAVLRTTIQTALKQAERKPHEIDLVVTTGGSAAIPAFQRVLNELFGEGRIQARAPFTSVAYGLAHRAQCLWS